MARTKAQDAARKRVERAERSGSKKRELAEAKKRQRAVLLPALLADVARAMPGRSLELAAQLLGDAFSDPDEKRRLFAAAKKRLEEPDLDELEELARVTRATQTALVRMTLAAALTGELPAREFTNANMRLSIFAKNSLPASGNDDDGTPFVEVVDEQGAQGSTH